MAQLQRGFYLCECTKRSKLMNLCAHFFRASHDLLEKIDVSGVHWRQICLAILKKEVVELLFGLHLRAQLIDIHCLKVHRFYKIS